MKSFVTITFTGPTGTPRTSNVEGPAPPRLTGTRAHSCSTMPQVRPPSFTNVREVSATEPPVTLTPAGGRTVPRTVPWPSKRTTPSASPRSTTTSPRAASVTPPDWRTAWAVTRP